MNVALTYFRKVDHRAGLNPLECDRAGIVVVNVVVLG